MSIYIYALTKTYTEVPSIHPEGKEEEEVGSLSEFVSQLVNLCELRHYQTRHNVSDLWYSIPTVI